MADRISWLIRERARLLRTAVHFIGARTIRISPSRVAGRLRRRGNDARDSHRYDLAASLYLEVLRFMPRDQATHIQAGHMFKEAGNYDRAEEHYRLAEQLGPRTADLALQLGHFLKLAGRPEEARDAYAEALALRPGWPIAAEELARLGGATPPLDDAPQPDEAPPIAELLPQAPGPDPLGRDTFQLRRLGMTREHSRWGLLKVLRGVEAIRGFLVTAADIAELHILLDDRLYHAEPLPMAASGTDDGGRRKQVFNAWCDFTAAPPGPAEVELRLVDRRGVTRRTHRETLLILPPREPDVFSTSDAMVMVPAGDTPLADRINAAPSAIRSAARTPPVIGTILVQRVDQLGDLICSMPAIRRLRAHYPHARLIGLVTSANADLARICGLFDEVVIADFSAIVPDGPRAMPPEAQRALRQKLATFDIDLAIDLSEGRESRPLLLLSGARLFAGFKDRDFPWLTAGFDFNGHDPLNRLEIMSPSRKLVALVEAVATMLGYRADVPAVPQRSIEPQGYAVLHAGARLVYSRWPYFIELADMLLAQTQLRLVLFSDDPEFADRARRHLPAERAEVLTGHLDFEKFDRILAGCDVFVGNDSGPKHLAAWRGVPVVSLHMARLNWNEWGQEGRGAIVSRRVPCAGCGIGAHGEECGKAFACLVNIRPEEVMETVQALLV